MAASWPIQFMKGSRPGNKRCQQSTEEDPIPKKKDRSQYAKNLPIVMIIKQLLDARVINFVQQTLTSSVTHETIDRLLRKIANQEERSFPI
jgi:hypothetical protein